MQALSLNDNIALVAGRDGYFLVNRQDYYIGKAIEVYGEYSGLESVFLLRLIRPGDCVIEVGANIGAHTVGLAKAVGPNGKVYAFEPQRPCYALLNAQVALNQLTNVFTFRQGVGQARGQMWLPPINYNARGNFAGVSLQQEAAQASEPVDIITLDEKFGETPCALLKIDVEGMEEDVLRGAQRLIRSQHPLLYLENDRVDKSRALVSLLLELDYRLYWHIPPYFNANNYFGLKENAYGNVVSYNVFCCHQEHEASAGLVEIKTADDPHPLAPKPMTFTWQQTIR
jgi:FkbM family methyltransferase